MKPEDGGWPRSRWELTAPESYALLYGQKGEGSQIFKLALLELVAHRLLTLTDAEQGFGYFGTRSVALLRPGPEQEPPRSRSLGAVLDLLDGPPTRKVKGGESGILLTELAQVARSRYGSFENYVEVEVMSALADRGLYRRQERRILGLFKVSRWEITCAGEAARAELEGSRSLGREQFHSWVDSDPARALAFLGLAGSSVLLMEELHPDIRRIREREYGDEAAFHGGMVGPHGDGLGGIDENVPEDAADDSSGELDPTTLDAPAFDIGAFDFDLGAFDGLDATLSSIDSGVGDAGGGWGGDGGGGGGGDGGGGGGGGGG